MRTQHVQSTLLASFLVLASCGGGGGGGGGNTPPPVTTILPTAAGILMPGDPQDIAANVMPRLLPSAANADDIEEDGYMRTRLEALLALDATVQEVNDAIDAQGIRIVSMDPVLPVLTLVVPATTSSDMADRAAALQATDAFSRVTLSYAAFDPEQTPTVIADAADAPAEERHDHQPIALNGEILPQPWRALRLIPAHNVAALSYEYVSSGLLVYVPGHFGRDDPDPRIPSMRMRSGYGIDSPFAANDGFIDCGMIGWDHDGSSASLPSHPTASEHLDMRAMQIAGMTWSERVREIASMLPPSRPSVMYTGLVYQSGADARDDFWRALDALLWRATIPHQDFVHITSSGDGVTDAAYNSPFGISRTFADLEDALSPFLVTSIETRALFATYADRVGSAATMQTTNTRIVGGADDTNTLFALSSTAATADMRAVGKVLAPCFAIDGVCTVEGFMENVGSRVAAAQIAGLASYLWTLARTATVQEILDALDHGWDVGSPGRGVVDAYAAVLALDDSLFGSPVRRTLLDVTGADPDVPDGVFDELDLERFLVVLSAPQGPGRERFDLNGNGDTGEGGFGAVDLDGDRTVSTATQGLENFVQDYDESQLRDIDVLCYYAYSDLYKGDSDLRAQYLAGLNGLGAASVTPFTDDTSHRVVAGVAINGQFQSQSFENFELTVDHEALAQMDAIAGLADASSESEAEILFGPGGNLIGMSASGVCTTEITNSDARIPMSAEAHAIERLAFHTDGPMDFELFVDYAGEVSFSGEYTVYVAIADDTAEIFSDEVVVPGGNTSGTVGFSGTLLPNPAGGGYRVYASVEATIADPFPAPNVAESRVNWGMSLALLP